MFPLVCRSESPAKLHFVQFPWQWLEPLDVVFAFFVAAGIGSLRTLAIRQIAIVMLLAAIAGSATCSARRVVG